MTTPESPEAPLIGAAAQRGLLALALLLSFLAALSAGLVDPPGNDYLLHGMMVERASTVLEDDGWSAFCDPWFPELNGGAALFRQYPHLPHQVVAIVARLTPLGGWTVFSASVFLGVLLLPLCFYFGARLLGLSPPVAAASAFVAATVRCLDPFGHDLLAYGLAGKGLFGQLWGMNLATLALPAWVAASLQRGAGLSRWAPWARYSLAALLLSATLRSSLPAGWLLLVCSATVVPFAGPRRTLLPRLRRFLGVGLGGVLLALGSLVPFFADLPTTNRTALEMSPEFSRSIGATGILSRFSGGDYFDGGLIGLWTPLLALAFVSPLLVLLKPRLWPARLRGLSVAGLVSLLLLFGRSFWGDWVDTLPLAGRFHDHRYLLGLHLVGPWLIAATLIRFLEQVRKRTSQGLFLGLTGVIVMTTVGPVFADLRAEQEMALATQTAFEANRGLLDRLLAETEEDLPHRVALARPDGMVGGTTWLSWLRREGALTMGRPLHHYHHVHDFSLWWSRWVSAADGDRGRPVHPEDLAAAGVRRLLDPSLGSGTVEGPGPILVRSDLLVHAASPNLDGIAIRWFQEGLHLHRQYPSIVFPGLAPASTEFPHSTRLEDRDTKALQGLPTVVEPLGHLLATHADGPAHIRVEVEVTEEEAWLLLPHAWHPRWALTLNGEAHPYGMLLPGWIGTPLPPGKHSVELFWPSSSLRGIVALLSLLTHALLLWLLLTRREQALRPSAPKESPCDT